MGEKEAYQVSWEYLEAQLARSIGRTAARTARDRMLAEGYVVVRGDSLRAVEAAARTQEGAVQ